MSEIWITTTDPVRAAKWEHIFGSNRLPVLSAATRWDVVDGQERPCYDLAMGRLSTWQRDRLAGYAHRRTGRPYEAVRREIEAAISWPVTAAGCELVVVGETAMQPSLLMLGTFARKSLMGWGGTYSHNRQKVKNGPGRLVLVGKNG